MKETRLYVSKILEHDCKDVIDMKVKAHNLIDFYIKNKGFM